MTFVLKTDFWQSTQDGTHACFITFEGGLNDEMSLEVHESFTSPKEIVDATAHFLQRLEYEARRLRTALPAPEEL